MLLKSMPDFSEFVRHTRIEAGLTQAELAAKVGKSRRWLYDVEAGNSEPSFAAALDLIRALGYQARLERPQASPDLDLIFARL